MTSKLSITTEVKEMNLGAYGGVGFSSMFLKPYHNGYLHIRGYEGKVSQLIFESICSKIDMHGRMTYYKVNDEEIVIGFDTNHSFDNEVTKSREYVENHLKELVPKLIKMLESYKASE